MLIDRRILEMTELQVAQFLGIAVEGSIREVLYVGVGRDF
jgi:hypothetical protein